MMRGALVCFVKTPGLSPIKSRLAAGVGPVKAAEFYELAIKAMRELMSHAVAESKLKLSPYWAVAEQQGLGHPLWQEFARIDQKEGSLGERLHQVYATLRAEYDIIMFLGADCPQLSSAALCASAAHAAASRDFVLGPAADGGFWLFAGSRPVPQSLWLAVPYSSATTAADLAKGLLTHAPVHWLDQQVDCDHASDLARLQAALQADRPRLLPSQQQLLTWLTEFGQSAYER